MDFANLVDMRLVHKTYGPVKITKVEYDINNIYDTKLVVKIQHDSRTKKFLIRSLDEFFIDLPDIINDVISEVKETKPVENRVIPQIDRTIQLSWYELDENDNMLSIEDWEQSKKYVVLYQYFNTDQNFNIPIVMDNSKLFINVLSACKYLKQSPVKVNGIYSICNGTETKSTYVGHKWRYANNSDINYIISKIKGN